MTTRKQYYGTITMILVLIALFTGFSNIAVAQAKTIRVATIATYPPFEWRDNKTGKLVGYDMDVLKAVTEKAGLNYDITLLDFKGIIPALLAGQVDMAITGMSITEKRAKKVDFSQPYYLSGIRLLVRGDNKDIRSADDLKGHKVATETGTTSHNYLMTHYPDLKLELFPASSPMYMALLNRNADAVMFDEPGIEYFIKTKGGDRVKTVGPLYEGEYFGMAFPKGSPLKEKINTALTALKKDGTLTKIYKKWFDHEPSQKMLDTTE